MDEMTIAIAGEGGPDIAGNFDIHFMYRHDSSVIATDHPLVSSLAAAAKVSGREAPIDAMPASCDAWFYNNQLEIPTLVFGGGSLSVAHSNNEHIPVAEMATAAEILVGTAIRFCGVRER